MNDASRAGGAVVLVRNDVTVDARVRREVDALRAAGLAPSVVGVTTVRAPERRGEVAGAPLTRLPGPRPRRATAPKPVADRRPAASRIEAAGTRLGWRARAGRALASLRFYRRGLGLVARRRPVLLHCNDHNTMWVGVAARVLFRTPVVYDAHELWADRNGRWEWRPWLLAAEWVFVRAAAATISASPGYADVMARRYHVQRPELIRNVPAAVAGPAPPRTDPRLTLVYAGGLLTGRGLEEAIAALPALPDARLVLLGPGSDAVRDALTALARETGVADRVELPDPVAPEELVDVLRTADVGLALIQPVALSYALTLPNKLFEYLAAGLPVIATDLPVLGRTVAELGVGELVPPGDPGAIAVAAQRLADPAVRARYLGRVAEAARELTWERERERLVAVYARVTAGA